uniref:Uncharacterized protein n=1 Tax=Oryza brachyantha TaxID=4533 RepID=J3MRU5_ORYBR
MGLHLPSWSSSTKNPSTDVNPSAGERKEEDSGEVTGEKATESTDAGWEEAVITVDVGHYKIMFWLEVTAKKDREERQERALRGGSAGSLQWGQRMMKRSHSF